MKKHTFLLAIFFCLIFLPGLALAAKGSGTVPQNRPLQPLPAGTEPNVSQNVQSEDPGNPENQDPGNLSEPQATAGNQSAESSTEAGQVSDAGGASDTKNSGTNWKLWIATAIGILLLAGLLVYEKAVPAKR